MNVLVDTLIHEQDIRVAINKPHDIPLDTLKLIFSHWQPQKYNIGERITGIHERTTGILFNAENIDEQFGEGLQVTGTAQDILMTIAGRKLALSKLGGEGITLLKSRLR